MPAVEARVRTPAAKASVVVETSITEVAATVREGMNRAMVPTIPQHNNRHMGLEVTLDILNLNHVIRLRDPHPLTNLRR